jgi:hypothetical protein
LLSLSWRRWMQSTYHIFKVPFNIIPTSTPLSFKWILYVCS